MKLEIHLQSIAMTSFRKTDHGDMVIIINPSFVKIYFRNSDKVYLLKY